MIPRLAGTPTANTIRKNTKKKNFRLHHFQTKAKMKTSSVFNLRESVQSRTELRIENKPIQIHQTDWYWLFRSYVTNSIDESPFRNLYREKSRMPQTEMRVLAAMYLLQESFGWSNTRLLNECMTNFKVRYALGLNSFTDSIPVIFVYNDFRSLLDAHFEKTGDDLIEMSIDSLIREESPVMKVSDHTLVLWSLNVA